MDCQKPKIAEKLVPFVEGALAEVDRREVTEHLPQCPVCSQEVKSLRQVVSMLRNTAGTKLNYYPPNSLPTSDVLDYALQADKMSDTVRRRIQLQLVESLEAQQEVELLRELDAELSQREEMIRIPPMPSELRSVVEEVYGRKSPAKKAAPPFFASLLERFGPRPLAAGALGIVFAGFVVHAATHRTPTSSVTSTDAVAVVSQTPEAASAVATAPPAASPKAKPKQPKTGKEEVALLPEKVHPEDLPRLSRLLWEKKVNHTYKDGQIYVAAEDVEEALLALNTNERRLVASAELKADRVDRAQAVQAPDDVPATEAAPPGGAAGTGRSGDAGAASGVESSHRETPIQNGVLPLEVKHNPPPRETRVAVPAAPVPPRAQTVRHPYSPTAEPSRPVSRREAAPASPRRVETQTPPGIHHEEHPVRRAPVVTHSHSAPAPRPVAVQSHHVASVPHSAAAPRGVIQHQEPRETRLAHDAKRPLGLSYNAPRQQQSVTVATAVDEGKKKMVASRPPARAQYDKGGAIGRPPQPREVALGQSVAPASNAAPEQSHHVQPPVPTEVNLPVKSAAPPKAFRATQPARIDADQEVLDAPHPRPVKTSAAAVKDVQTSGGLKPVPKWSDRERAANAVDRRVAADRKAETEHVTMRSTAPATVSMGEPPAPLPRQVPAVVRPAAAAPVPGIVSAGAVGLNTKDTALMTQAKKLVFDAVGESEVLMERRDDSSLMVTVKPQRALNQSETEQLRKVLRKKLKLDDADSVVIRQP